MAPAKNLPLLLNSAYYGFNRALPGGDLAPVFNPDGSVKETFCNRFIQYVLNNFGYVDMNELTANRMHVYMEDPHHGWISVSDEVAQHHANNGVIVLASKPSEGDGHVCLIIPGILEKSTNWAKSVPKCANVGKDVFIGKKVSFAFQADNQPIYFALSGMI